MLYWPLAIRARKRSRPSARRARKASPNAAAGEGASCDLRPDRSRLPRRSPVKGHQGARLSRAGGTWVSAVFAGRRRRCVGRKRGGGATPQGRRRASRLRLGGLLVLGLAAEHGLPDCRGRSRCPTVGPFPDSSRFYVEFREAGTFAVSDLSARLHIITPQRKPTRPRRGHGRAPARSSAVPRCRSAASPP